ncbi:MAG: hypothetical protein LLG05_14740 [Porphyromonadaceae bacterium]|nr:hypothetical protein [Porphyromonadaceae bacterium]
MVTTPLRDMETFIGKARTQVAQIKGTKGALEEEAGAATGVATAMDKKAAAKTRATQANRQLAQSAGVTATSINKVKGEVTGATVATREYTGRVQDLDKNYVPIVAPNGSAADAKKMAEYEKAMTSEKYLKTWQAGFLGSSGYAFNPLGGSTYGLTSSKFGTQRIHPEMENFLKTLTYGNGIGAYAPINAYESHIENLGRQLREQEWVQGSAFPNISQNAMIKGNSDINPLWNEQISASKKYDALETQAMRESFDLSTIGAGRDSASMKKFEALNKGIDEYETALHKYDGVAGKQLLISDKFNTGKARLSGSISSFGDTVGRTLKSSSGKLKGAATGGLEWLGALAGLGGVTGGAIVLGAAVGIGAYYAAWKSGYFDTATKKANNALKVEANYVKQLSDKKNDLQKRQEALTNEQAKYTEGSKEYIAYGSKILELNQQQIDAQTDLDAAQKILTADQTRAAKINADWANVKTTDAASYATAEAAAQAALQKKYGASGVTSSTEAQYYMGIVEKQHGTIDAIWKEKEQLKSEQATGLTTLGKHAQTPTGQKDMTDLQLAETQKIVDYMGMQQVTYDPATGTYTPWTDDGLGGIKSWYYSMLYNYSDKPTTATNKALMDSGVSPGGLSGAWDAYMSTHLPISLLTSKDLWDHPFGDKSTQSWLGGAWGNFSKALFGGLQMPSSTNSTSSSNGGLNVAIGSIITKLSAQEAQNAVTNAIVAAAQALQMSQSTKAGE